MSGHRDGDDERAHLILQGDDRQPYYAWDVAQRENTVDTIHLVRPQAHWASESHPIESGVSAYCGYHPDEDAGHAWEDGTAWLWAPEGWGAFGTKDGPSWRCCPDCAAIYRGEVPDAWMEALRAEAIAIVLEELGEEVTP